MAYRYTQRNFLEEPPTYMYAAFEGDAFLKAYFDDRERFIAKLAKSDRAIAAEEGGKSLRRMLEPVITAFQRGHEHPAATEVNALSSRALERFTVDREIDTRRLLVNLVSTQMNGSHEQEVKPWLDRLVQRFEVSKKLFANYQADFRKRGGSADHVDLYWLLATSLCLFYGDTQRLKYLSTLLKVDDLLCSLSVEKLKTVVPDSGLTLLIRAEMTWVRQLLAQKGITIAS